MWILYVYIFMEIQGKEEMIFRMKKREKGMTRRGQWRGRTKWGSGRKSKHEREGDKGPEKARKMGRR